MAYHFSSEYGIINNQNKTETIRYQETMDKGCEHDNRIATNGSQIKYGIGLGNVQTDRKNKEKKTQIIA